MNREEFNNNLELYHHGIKGQKWALQSMGAMAFASAVNMSVYAIGRMKMRKIYGF